MKREPGFYWVSVWGGDDWRVAEYRTVKDGRKYWLVCGDADQWDETDFEEIGERVERPTKTGP